MLNNIIKLEDNIYIVKRILNSSTSEETATGIHYNLGTDSLLRDKEGKWFCCLLAKDAQFRDVELVTTESKHDYTGTEFELGDNGGLG